MSMSMTFTPDPNWSFPPLADRIAGIIGRTDSCPPYPKKDDPNQWVLNALNDWFLGFNPDGTWELRYRYVLPDAQWAALQTVIEMFVCKQKET